MSIKIKNCVTLRLLLSVTFLKCWRPGSPLDRVNFAKSVTDVTLRMAFVTLSVTHSTKNYLHNVN